MTAVTARVLVNARDLGCDALEASVSWGRRDPDGQPDAATATVVLSDNDAALAMNVAISDRLQIVVRTQAGESTRFTGTVSDVQISHTARQTVISAHALMARLSRVWLSDDPWPQETDGQRILRILTLAGIRTAVPVTWAQAAGSWLSPDVPGFPPIAVDLSPWAAQPGPWRLRPGTWRQLKGAAWRDLKGPAIDTGRIPVAALDVDRRNTADLLRDTAESAAGVIFDQPDGTIGYHDSWHRTHAPDVDLSACLWLADGARFLLSLGTVVNTVTLSYGTTTGGQEQGSVTATMPGSIEQYGPVETSRQTILAEQADAYLIANRQARWAGWPRWAVDALDVDSAAIDRPADLARLLAMRLGDTMLLRGIAAPAPAQLLSLIVEGAAERITADTWQATYSLSDTRQTVLPYSWDAHALAAPDRRWTDVPAGLPWIDSDNLILGA